MALWKWENELDSTLNLASPIFLLLAVVLVALDVVNVWVVLLIIISTMKMEIKL